MHAAQAEAAAQEELAELANGELEEYQRRMAAEVQHARQEALRSAEAKCGGGISSHQAGFNLKRPGPCRVVYLWGLLRREGSGGCCSIQGVFWTGTLLLPFETCPGCTTALAGKVHCALQEAIGYINDA